MEHEYYLNIAFDLAAQASSRGDHPFGALIVQDSTIISQANNTVVTGEDPTNHAELLAIKSIFSSENHHKHDNTVLYSSTEPCAMCFGAIIWAGIDQVVFGCSTQGLAKATGRGSFVMPCAQMATFAKSPPTIIGPMMENQFYEQHVQYWQKDLGEH